MSTPSLSKRMAQLAEAAAITDILALAEKPEVISFAGGLPAPETLATGGIGQALQRSLERDGAAALNYGPASGNGELRRALAGRMSNVYGVPRVADQVHLTSGGAEAFLLVTMALCDPGDTVLVGAPTYLVAIHILRAMGVQVVEVPVDEDGLRVEELDSVLKDLHGRGVSPRFLYTIPSFQNPTGSCLGLDRRRRLVARAATSDLLVVEDHAYGDLRFEGEDLPCLASLDPDRVVFLHTFSKIVAPGFRLGWLSGSADLVRAVSLCKVATDSCASTIGQRAVLDLLVSGSLDAGIERARAVYRRRRDAMLGALERHMPRGVSWNRPEGGFYIWLDLGPEQDGASLLERALTRHNVAFVAGSAFHAHGGGKQNLRLSYSLVPEEQIDDGIRRLARAMEAGAG